MALTWSRGWAVCAIVFIASAPWFAVTASAADLLPELVRYLTREHNLVIAAEEDVLAARQRARIALGDWFPNLDVTAAYGYEDQKNPNAADTNQVTRDLDLKITQLLWDFGKTNAAVRREGLVLDQALTNLEDVRQDTLRLGVTAYLNVIRGAEVLEFATQSVANIKRQTELENALVVAGRGFSTDVLQAKARLAGAESRRLLAMGKFKVAQNEFRAVFEREPTDAESWVRPQLPLTSLPDTLDGAIRGAEKNNPSLRSAILGIRIAEEDVNRTESDSFFPRLQGVLEQSYQKDFSGTVGFERDSLGKVEFTFPFNLGFTAVNTLRAAKHDQTAVVRRVSNTRDQVEKRTRDAWTNLQTAQLNGASLKNQTEIVTRFLEKARDERKAGRRSLLDILDGETQLINAQSDAAEAEIDVAVAIYELLAAMGSLSEAQFGLASSGDAGPTPGSKTASSDTRSYIVDTGVEQSKKEALSQVGAKPRIDVAPASYSVARRADADESAADEVKGKEEDNDRATSENVDAGSGIARSDDDAPAPGDPSPVTTVHDGDVLAHADTPSRPDDPAETRSPNDPATETGEDKKGLAPESGTGSSENRHRDTTVGEGSGENRVEATPGTFGSMPAAIRVVKAEADLNYIRDRHVSLLAASGGTLAPPTAMGEPAPEPVRPPPTIDILRKANPDLEYMHRKFLSLLGASGPPTPGLTALSR